VRLALVRLGALVATLLALALALVPAASAAGGGEPDRQVDVHLGVHGFQISVEGHESGGKGGVILVVTRHQEVAEYIVPGTVTESSIKARFGTLGEVDYSFGPKKSADAECFGSTGGAAAFSGTFEFTGENGYVHIDADHAQGYYQVEPESRTCKSGRSSGSSASARAVAARALVGDEGATLTAQAGAKGSRPARILSVYGSPKASSEISAFLEEGVGKMVVLRGVRMSLKHRDFAWDFVAGTATITPPAPFTGTATFIRRAGGKPLLRGSLALSVLGSPKLVRMTGADFRAALHRGIPEPD